MLILRHLHLDLDVAFRIIVFVSLTKTVLNTLMQDQKSQTPRKKLYYIESKILMKVKNYFTFRKFSGQLKINFDYN